MAQKVRTLQHKRDIPADGFAKVAAAVEIQDVRFVSFGASFIPEAVENQGLAVRFSVQTRTCADGDNNRIFVVADFVMEATSEANKDENQKAVSACARIRLEYKADSAKDFDQESLEHFGRVNGVYNAWPYWREFVQSAIARMELPTLIVPVFRVVKQQAKQDAGDEKTVEARQGASHRQERRAKKGQVRRTTPTGAN